MGNETASDIIAALPDSTPPCARSSSPAPMTR